MAGDQQYQTADGRIDVQQGGIPRNICALNFQRDYPVGGGGGKNLKKKQNNLGLKKNEKEHFTQIRHLP